MELNDTLDNKILSMVEVPSESKKKKVTQKTNKNEKETASTEVAVINKPINCSLCISVNPKQRGNPIIKSITKCPWQFDEIVPDYIVGKTACILYLSIRYHNLNPDYIHARLKQLGKMFELRVLLVQVDIKEPSNALKHLTRICLLANLTLILAWNAEEAGKIIETYKLYENKLPDLIMERSGPDGDQHQKLISALTNIKPVNKTDAMTLIQNYGTLSAMINSTENSLATCPGFGPRKANKLHKVFNENFLKK